MSTKNKILLSISVLLFLSCTHLAFFSPSILANFFGAIGIILNVYNIIDIVYGNKR